MATRKKGGQRLIEMARKRRKSSSKPKAKNRLKEQLEEYKSRRPKPKRQKGGQQLLTPRKPRTRATKEGPGGRYSVTPLPKAKTTRKYTPKEKADYEKRYKETTRKPDPAFTRTKPKPAPKATTKPVVKPPKGGMGPSYYRRKGKGHGFGSKPQAAAKPKAGIAPKRGSLTAAQKRTNEQRRKNLRSEIEGRMKPDDVGRLAKLYGKVTGKKMTHLDEAQLAGHIAAEGLGALIGGPFVKGGLKVGRAGLGAARVGGAAALKAGKKVAGKAVKAGTKAAKSAKATAVKTGKAVRAKAVKTSKAVGRAARTGVTKAKTGARKLKELAKKADAALLRAQKLARGKGGKLTKTTKKKAPAKKTPAKKKPKKPESAFKGTKPRTGKNRPFPR